MRMYLVTLFNVLIVLFLFSGSIYANEMRGVEVYREKLEYRCGFPVEVFAHKYTKEEWKYAKGHCQLGKYMKQICPAGASFFRSTKFKKKYVAHLYEYVIQHAE